MFDMTEYEKALKELDFTSIKRSIEHDGNEWERDILKNANDVAESISGRFGIYTYEGIVVLERWDD